MKFFELLCTTKCFRKGQESHIFLVALIEGKGKKISHTSVISLIIMKISFAILLFIFPETNHKVRIDFSAKIFSLNIFV